MKSNRPHAYKWLFSILAVAALTAACPQPVDQEAIDRVTSLRADFESFDPPVVPPPPHELAAPHRQSLSTFRDLCVSLLDTCRDAIASCAACDIKKVSCVRQCEFMSAICDAAGKCVDAYIASLQVAPE